MSVLIIGAEQEAEIASLKALAAENIHEVAVVEAASRDMAAFRFDMQRYSIELPVGYIVTYTHERQSDPMLGVVQHISVSIATPNRMPSIEAVEMILRAFGMAPIKDSIGVWPETVEPGLGAVNVVQFLLPGAGPS